MPRKLFVTNPNARNAHHFPAVAPSLLAADPAFLAQELKDLEAAGADRLHIDVMDGHFVPNLALSPAVVKRIAQLAPLPLDVHLMTAPPRCFVELFSGLPCASITVHIETLEGDASILDLIRNSGAQAGLAINPQTPLEALTPFLDAVKHIVFMTVSPGFGGQAFQEDQLPRLAKLKTMCAGKNIKIHVDGGVNDQNAPLLWKAGADVLVAGSFIMKQKNQYQKAIKSLRP